MGCEGWCCDWCDCCTGASGTLMSGEGEGGGAAADDDGKGSAAATPFLLVVALSFVPARATGPAGGAAAAESAPASARQRRPVPWAWEATREAAERQRQGAAPARRLAHACPRPSAWACLLAHHARRGGGVGLPRRRSSPRRQAQPVQTTWGQENALCAQVRHPRWLGPSPPPSAVPHACWTRASCPVRSALQKPARGATPTRQQGAQRAHLTPLQATSHVLARVVVVCVCMSEVGVGCAPLCRARAQRRGVERQRQWRGDTRRHAKRRRGTLHRRTAYPRVVVNECR
jgi:hypothetical protein